MATAWDQDTTHNFFASTWKSSSPGNYFRPGIHSNINKFCNSNIYCMNISLYTHTYYWLVRMGGSFITEGHTVSILWKCSIMRWKYENNAPVSWQTCNWNCVCWIWLKMSYLVMVTDWTEQNTERKLHHLNSIYAGLSLEFQDPLVCQLRSLFKFRQEEVISAVTSTKGGNECEWK